MEKMMRLSLFFCLTGSFAQQATVSSGGNASGNNGSSSYSIGQVAYTNQTGSGGKVNQGVQQPFEIFLLGEDDFPEITLTMSVYPNPASSVVNLNIQNFNAENLHYQLFDLNGRLVQSQQITQSETAISLENNANAIYLLYVSADGKLLKTFKIVKN